MMKSLKKDLLGIKIFKTREEMGEAAASDAEIYINGVLSQKNEMNIVFAAAPSQNDVLASLSKKNIPWRKINAYHMDEYVGLSRTDPPSFGHYLYEHIFSLVPFKSVHYIAQNGKASEEACQDYCSLLEQIHIDIVFMGVGENGHIAFNDPQFAFFDDPEIAKIVELDDVCRMQQVHDGCFPSIDDVPKKAVTLTIPTLMSADKLFNVVPTAFKAEAVKDIVTGDITEECPASICRRHAGATLYLDGESSSYII